MNRKELKEEKEKEKLRTLSLKGKCWYLWAYYKIPDRKSTRLNSSHRG